MALPPRDSLAGCAVNTALRAHVAAVSCRESCKDAIDVIVGRSGKERGGEEELMEEDVGAVFVAGSKEAVEAMRKY